MDSILDTIIAELTQVVEEASTIWVNGGWAMVMIAIIALMMFGLGMRVWLRLRESALGEVPEHIWRQWIRKPRDRRGKTGRMLDFVTGGRTIQDTALFFEQLRTTKFAPFERDLKVMKVCVSSAPLVGLLGTVTGMLSTFDALASGSGGDKTMGMIASGISEALITTETGLVIALPGLFFHHRLQRGFESYRAFLAHVETVCTQTLHRESRSSTHRDARRAALREVARRLQVQGKAAS